MSETPHWTAEQVDERLRGLQRDDPAGLAASRDEPLDRRAWSYVEAAAVLSSFDPEELRPLDDAAPRVDALRLLLGQSIPVFEEDGRAQWRLKAAARREALHRLGSRTAILAACGRNRGAADDPLERAFVDVLEGTSERFDSWSYDRLAQLLEVSDALYGIVDGIPDVEYVERLRERAAVLEPLRALVGTRFRGREKELAQLAEYVSGEQTRTVRLRRRSAGEGGAVKERLPLLVLGLGGIGKSTLLAKFILDHAGGEDPVAFAYLDFDRPTVSAAEPATILLEAARQLSVQCGESHRSGWGDFQSRWAVQLTSARRSRSRAIVEPTSRVVSQEPGGLHTAAMIEEFARHLDDSFEPTVPFLLVLDTFEEVQYRSRELVAALWRFLDELRDCLPVLRTVVAGRAPIEGHKTETLTLASLDRTAAVGFLAANGVTDEETAEALISRLGCSPLTLSLAAAVVRLDEGGMDAIRDVTRRQRLFLFSVDHQTAQVELYRRLLRHIHDPNVSKLAHPGLVLRRITPDLIRHVLAQPCALDVRSDEEARQLFEGLRAEITLVRAAEDGALEHRTDVRRAMLPMLRENEPEAVAAIHEHAVQYLSQSHTVIDRAEEIYHRLAAGQEPTEVDSRWIDGIDDRLRGAVGELPPRAQAYLAGRLGLEIDPATWKAASGEDVERRTEQRALDHLSVGRPRDALEVLRVVRERVPVSRLYLYEAQALQLVGDLEAALETVDQAFVDVPDRGSGPTTLDLLVLGANLEIARGHGNAAVGRIDDAYRTARWLDDKPRMLQIGARRLQLWRRDRREKKEHLGVQTEVHTDLCEISADALAAHSSAAHLLASELGGSFPDEIVRVARAVGLPQLRPDRVQRAIVLWNYQLRGGLEDDAAAVAMIAGTEAISAPAAMDVLLGLLSRHELTAGAARSIASEVRYALEKPRRKPDE
jgi:cellulose synthase operon protein C